MPPRRVALAFLALWWTLGIALLAWSIATVHGAVAAGRPASHHAAFHAALVGSVEAIGALLFLIPRTMRVGAALLVVTFAAALLLHALEHQFRGDLIVYAAAVVYIAVHGPVPLAAARR